MTTPDPAAIARGLTVVQKQILSWVCQRDGSGINCWMSDAVHLAMLGLVYKVDGIVKATPLGVAVRDELNSQVV